MPVFNQDPKIKSSVASWDDLTDRPFGEFITECGETLAWDGTPTATAVAIGDITYYRVSDSTPTIEELTGGSMNSVLGENTYPVSLKAEDFEQRNEHVIFCNAWDGTPFIVVNEDDAEAEMNGESLTFAKKGIYFILTSYGVYVKDLTVTGYNFTKVEIKKIDKAYLSEALPEVSEEDDDKSLFVEKGKWVAKYPNIIYDGKVNTEYGASTSRAKGELDTVLSLTEGNTYKVVYDGTAYECVCSVKSNGDGQDYLCLGDAHFLATVIESTGEPFCVLLAESRTTLHCSEEGEHTLTISGEVGSALPAITEEDEGKVLTAKDGKAVWEESTGGADKWIDLEDRPFGDVFVDGGETLAWDGTATEAAVTHGMTTYYRVSDSTPSADEMVGGLVNILFGETVMPADITADALVELGEHVTSFGGDGDDQPRFVVVYADDAVAEVNGDSLTFPKKGIYFFYTVDENGEFVSRSQDITVTGYNFTKVEVKKIDKGYLPDDIFAANIIVADSLDAVPADLPERSLVAVPSSGESGGFPVVELTTEPYGEEGAQLTDAESAEIEAAFAKGLPVIIKFHINYEQVKSESAALFDKASVTSTDAENNTTTNFRGLVYSDVRGQADYVIQSINNGAWFFVISVK